MKRPQELRAPDQRKEDLFFFVRHSGNKLVEMLRAFLALWAVGAFATTPCSDTRPECAKLARSGRCVEDPEHVYACPSACGACTSMCQDTRVECPSWASVGECESNPQGMRLVCPLSCGICKPQCADLSVNCPRWAHEGRCIEPHAASVVCPRACGQCDSTLCVDKHTECRRWAHDAQCIQNPTYMRDVCPKSCGACRHRDPSPCTDGNASQCLHWKDQCDLNPAVATFCPRSCGVCAARCVDKSSRCALWKSACSDAAMLGVCPQTCGLCEVLYRDRDHDEL